MKLWLTSFCYIDECDALHIDLPRMLKAMGVDDTHENRDKLAGIARQHLESMLKDTKAVITITE
jgi:hypothetical protein